MIDLHTHTFYSDGVLIPSELLRRAESMGIRAIALTDHIDTSNIDTVKRLAAFAAEMEDQEITLLPGAELTHVPPTKIEGLVQRCRAAGAKIALVHGETIVEPVAPGTNRAAIEAGVDILAHPGLIESAEAALAVENGVALEISGRGGHSFTNGHVVRMAQETGATLIFNSDAHQPRDLMDTKMAARVAAGAGLDDSGIVAMFAASAALVKKRQ